MRHCDKYPYACDGYAAVSRAAPLVARDRRRPLVCGGEFRLAMMFRLLLKRFPDCCTPIEVVDGWPSD
jgi:hypothetical protein